jgi:hypothetical protein
MLSATPRDISAAIHKVNFMIIEKNAWGSNAAKHQLGVHS